MQAVTITQITPTELESLIASTLEKVLASQKPEQFEADERITRHDICKLYKVSLPTVHECMKKGLPYEKIGRKTLFRRSDVDKFFQEKRGKK